MLFILVTWCMSRILAFLQPTKLNIISSDWNFHCPHFIVKESEAQKILVTCLRLKYLNQFDSKVILLYLLSFKYYYRKMRQISPTIHINQSHSLTTKPHSYMKYFSISGRYGLWYFDSLNPTASYLMISKDISHHFINFLPGRNIWFYNL